MATAANFDQIKAFRAEVWTSGTTDCGYSQAVLYRQNLSLLSQVTRYYPWLVSIGERRSCRSCDVLGRRWKDA